jgi:ankyrin repeat protein
MTRLRLFILVILALVLNVVGETHSAEAEEAQIKAYDDTKNESELYNLIVEKEFKEALKRVQEVPSEAKILIQVLGGSKGVDVVKTGLPLHFAFDVDLPENLPQAKRQATMSQEQADLILALLEENALATVQKDKFGRTPLHLALISPVPPTAKVLTTMLQLYPKSARMQGLQGLTPLHMAVSYPMTTLENVKALLEAYPGASEVLDEDNSLPIHAAAWGGDFPESKSVIELLLKQNPSHLSVSDGDDETILTLMSKYGRTSQEAVRFVLQQDKKAVYRGRDEMEGNTAIHHAVSASYQQNNTVYKPFLEYHKELLKKTNRLGRLPLHIALQRCCAAPEMVQDLIEGFPQGASSRDEQGFLPIHHACNAGVTDVKIVQSLVDIAPESIKMELTTSRSRRGPLPLHLALAYGANQGEAYDTMNEVVEMLLSRYPDAAKIKDPDGDLLPMVQAFISKRSASVLKHFMKLTPNGISAKVYINEGGEKKSTTLLHLFAAQAHAYMEPKDINEIIEVFAAHDPELFRQKDTDGRLPLHMVWLQLETIEASRQALVDALLANNPDAVHVADKQNAPPLTYVAKARDLHGFEKIFAMNPFASAVKSEGGLYPLHFLCNFGATGALSESVDKMMTSLLNQHPAAAGEPDEKGNLPLHFFCKTAGAGHTKTQTIQELINAYPEALNITDENGMLPLQLVGLSAAESDDVNEHDHWAGFNDVLVDMNPSAVSTVREGKLPLPAAIDRTETLSIHRRHPDDHMLRIIRRLYEVYPQGVKEETSKKRNGLHSLLVLLGDMGGMAPTGWSDLTLKVIRDFPELAREKDIHARTPLHIFCLYLGDTAMGLRDHQDNRTRSNIPGLEDTFVALIQAYPDAMDKADQYMLNTLELVTHDRLRYAKGGKRFYNAQILNMMKSYLRRGSDYWKMRNTIENAMTCTELRGALENVKEQVQAKLNELEVEPSNLNAEAHTCKAKTMKLCQACRAEQELLGDVENSLAAYAQIMEERGKDAAEVSGDYYPGGYSY